MTFGDAIRDGFSKYTTFSGRSSRAAYWWWWLFSLIVVVAAEVIDAIIGTNYILALIVWIVLLLPSLAVAVRRLHDAGHSGWWLLIGILLAFAGGRGWTSESFGALLRDGNGFKPCRASHVRSDFPRSSKPCGTPPRGRFGFFVGRICRARPTASTQPSIPRS